MIRIISIGAIQKTRKNPAVKSLGILDIFGKKDGAKKEKKPRKKTMTLCPQCGGRELYYEAGLVTGYKYHCKDCDYVGMVVIERDIDDMIKEENEKKENEGKKEEVK